MCSVNIMSGVWAIVVTYNRVELLKICISALRGQSHPIDHILVINNGSTDGTMKWLDAQTDLEILHQDNCGGAGGFYEGMKYSYEKGAEYLWLMDDDGYPDKDCLARLFEEADSSDVGVFNALVLNIDDHSKLAFNFGGGITTFSEAKDKSDSKGLIKFFANPFNGTLIARPVVEHIGLVKKEMFIWGDENEYFKRLVKANIPYATSIKALFYHPESKTIFDRVLFGRIKVAVKPEKLEGNFFRNLGYIDRVYYSKISLKMISAYMIYFLVKCQPRRMFLFLKYYFDGWLNRYKLPNFSKSYKTK